MASITADTAGPSSARAEQDVRLVSSHPGEVAPGEIALGVIIGRTSEFFDFFVFGLACVLVFPKHVFPTFPPLTGTLLSYGLFALAFLARPVGSVVFITVDRRYGRATKLTAALFLLGTSTCLIAFLPGYQTVGTWSAVLLAMLRVGQGFALGGTWDGLASLLSMNAPKARRGWFAMLPQLGAPFGFIMASSLFAFFLLNLSTDDFLDWGWRYPFFVAFTINVVALFARLRLVATEDFRKLLEADELNPEPVLDTVRTHGRTILVGAFVPLAGYALFHLVTVFPVSWINLFTQRSVGEFLMVQAAGAVVAAGAMVTSGLVADQIGRRSTIMLAASLIGLFAIGSILAPLLLGDSLAGQTIYVIIGFLLLGLAYGQSSGAIAEQFGTRYRYTGSALTSDLAWLIGAGFAPLVALAASSRLGLPWVGVYLLSGAICTLAALGIDGRLKPKA